MRKNHFLYIIIALLLLLPTTTIMLSCTKDGDVIYMPEDNEDNRPMIFFIHRENLMGDLTYNDVIYRGVMNAVNQHDLLSVIIEISNDPATMEFHLNKIQTIGEQRRVLIVMSNTNFEPLLYKCEKTLRESTRVDFLLTESRDTKLPIHTIYFPLYGACYQAGRLVNSSMNDVNNLMIVNANHTNNLLADMRSGFTTGVNDDGGRVQIENHYLSDSDGGYDMADYTYNYSYEIDPLYQMVLPLCGGSTQGFLRYNRRYAHSFYTLGIDSDMQKYSSRVPFSIVKHLDIAVQSWIAQWVNSNTMPLQMSLGLESGYTELIIADSHKEILGATAEKFKQIAIEKENEYESKK